MIRDVNRIAAALVCALLGAGMCAFAAELLVPDTAPHRPAFAIAEETQPATPAAPATATPVTPLAPATASAPAAVAQTMPPPAGAPATAAIAVPPAPDAATVERGTALAAENCSPCHTLTKNGPSAVGPNLFGLLDRPVASVSAFHYSAALRALGGRWSADRLDGWIADPQAMAPGTLMGFSGLPDAGQRADLIRFLRTLAPAPGTASGDAFEALVDKADAKEGAAIADAQCSACHGFDQGGTAMVGPNLFGVVGRGIAQAPDYRYSTALAAHGGTWTVALLGDWLADPKHVAPGTKMGFAGIADAPTRAKLVAYLKSLHP